MEVLFCNSAESNDVKPEFLENEFCCQVLQKSLVLIFSIKPGEDKMTGLVESVGPERI